MKDERIVKAQNKPVEIEAKELGVVDLPLRDNRGVERHLTDLKGKVVLLDFHVLQQRVLQNTLCNCANFTISTMTVGSKSIWFH